MADSFIPLKFKIDSGGNPIAWAEYQNGETAVMPGSFNLTGSSRRLLGDFSNSTVANKLAFQSSTTNGATDVIAIPNGTGAFSAYTAYSSSAPDSTTPGGRIIADSGSTTFEALGSSTVARVATNGAERSRWDVSGGFYIGTTNTDPPANQVNGFYRGPAGAVNIGSNGAVALRLGQPASAATTLTQWYNGGVIVGSISTTPTTTAYNTTSDYRAKYDVTPLVSCWEHVKELHPVKYHWVGHYELGWSSGFLAHELADILPEAVSGEKDAVDDEGKPIYQGVDYSKLVPMLTAALQESIRRIEVLEAEVELLKATAE